MKLYIISHYTWLSIAIFLLFFLNVAKYAINFSADDINPWNGFTGRMTSRVNLQENDRSFFNELMWQNPTITRETFQNQNVVHLGDGALELIDSAIEARNLRQEMEDHALILEVLQGKGAMGSIGLEGPWVDKSYTDTGMNNIHHIKKFTNTGVDDLHHTKKINQLMYSVDQDFNLRHLHSVRVNMARSSSRRKSSSSSGMTGSSLRGGSKSSLGKRRSNEDINDEEEEDDSSKDNVASERNLSDLHFSDSMLEVLNGLGDNTKSHFENIAIKYGHKLKTINNKDENRKIYSKFRQEVKKALDHHQLGHLINMGDELNDQHLLVMILHFATEAERDVTIPNSDGLSKMNYKISSCIAFAKEHLASSLIREDHRQHNESSDDDITKEAAAREYWEEHKDEVIASIATLDHRFFISRDKDNFHNEVKEIADIDKTVVAVLDLIGVMNAAFHYLHYNFVYEGGKMSSIITSTHVFNTAYDGEINTEAALVNARGYIPHSECWLGGYIRNAATYNTELLHYFDGVLNDGFRDIFRVVLKKEEGYELSTTVATRFGLGDLTPEEHARLAELLLEIRIRGGTTSGLMRQLAKELFKSIKYLVTSCCREDGTRD